MPERYTTGNSIVEVLLSNSKIQPETKHYHHLWGKAGITHWEDQTRGEKKIIISPQEIILSFIHWCVSYTRKYSSENFSHLQSTQVTLKCHTKIMKKDLNSFMSVNSTNLKYAARAALFNHFQSTYPFHLRAILHIPFQKWLLSLTMCHCAV